MEKTHTAARKGAIINPCKHIQDYHAFSSPAVASELYLEKTRQRHSERSNSPARLLELQEELVVRSEPGCRVKKMICTDMTKTP